MELVLHQVSRSILSALKISCPYFEGISDLLRYLTEWESRPIRLAEMAYEWCAVIWENRQSHGNWKTLLLLALEVGFRHINPQGAMEVDLTHTRQHEELIEVVFMTNKSESIGDFLCAFVGK